jgi:MSHA biogenesis protein MshK
VSRSGDVMTTRTSFELHADRCRVVEVHTLSAGGRGAAHDVRVRTFVTNLPDDPRSADFTDSLRRVRDERRLARQATVTVWGLKSTHRYLRLPDAGEHDLHTRAIREAADDIALLEADGTPARIAVTWGSDVSIDGRTHREVSLTAASATDIERRLEPFASAGFEIVRAVTPAMALASVARARVDRAPGETSMYVALAPHATCVAIVREGLLLLAREIQWGHADAEDEQAEPFDRRLAAELRRSLLLFKQRFRATADRIALCGDVDHLRSLSGTLSTISGLPVETLDSLSGIDATAVPQPADEFRADVAALRPAIAVGAEAPPYSNLLPSTDGGGAHSRTMVWSLAGGLAAALVLVGIWYGVRRWSGPASTPARDNTPRQAGATAPTNRRPESPQVVPRGGRSSQPPPAAVTPPEIPRTPAADVTAATPPTPAAQPEREVVVTSILYSADRKLAIVDGRIARPGDRIGSISIVEIRPRAIVVESPGRGRRIVSMRLPAASGQ